jgi:hypothetical protein
MALGEPDVIVFLFTRNILEGKPIRLGQPLSAVRHAIVWNAGRRGTAA